MSKRSWKSVVAVLVVVILTITGLTAIPVMAQGEETTSTPQSGKRCEEFLTKVADNLGVSVDDLKSAITDARQEMLDESVEAGKITQEQADRIKQRMEDEGSLCGLSIRGFRGRHGQMEMLDEAVEAGKITQERADRIKQRIEDKGGLWGLGMRGFRGNHGQTFGKRGFHGGRCSPRFGAWQR